MTRLYVECDVSTVDVWMEMQKYESNGVWIDCKLYKNKTNAVHYNEKSKPDKPKKKI